MFHCPEKKNLSTNELYTDDYRNLCTMRAKRTTCTRQNTLDWIGLIVFFLEEDETVSNFSTMPSTMCGRRRGRW